MQIHLSLSLLLYKPVDIFYFDSVNRYMELDTLVKCTLVKCQWTNSTLTRYKTSPLPMIYRNPGGGRVITAWTTPTQRLLHLDYLVTFSHPFQTSESYSMPLSSSAGSLLTMKDLASSHSSLTGVKPLFKRGRKNFF